MSATYHSFMLMLSLSQPFGILHCFGISLDSSYELSWLKRDHSGMNRGLYALAINCFPAVLMKSLKTCNYIETRKTNIKLNVGIRNQAI